MLRTHTRCDVLRAASPLLGHKFEWQLIGGHAAYQVGALGHPFNKRQLCPIRHRLITPKLK